MTAYYNEIDPQAAQWLRNLIAAGHIAPGEVDERSIADVAPSDLVGFDQCHFFAGIGVWSHALRSAGWPDHRPVWTGSCPCQPFSDAGAGRGFDDERHLWPAFFRLIRERRPGVVFGEQVASKDALAWLDHVQADMEGEDYAFGPLDLCAAGFGAPHIRQRLFFVAESESGDGRGELDACGARSGRAGSSGGCLLGDANGARGAARLPEPAEREEGLAGISDDAGREQSGAGHRPTAGFWGAADWLPCRDGKARAVEPGTFPLAHGAQSRLVRLRAYGNAIVAPVAEEFIRAYLEVTTSSHRQGTEND